jgi:hypothetical protein
MTIRLSAYFFIFFVIFLVLANKLSKISISTGSVVLLSVGVAIFGFYLAPLLAARKRRNDELTTCVSMEANILNKISIEIEDLPTSVKDDAIKVLRNYVSTKTGDYRPTAGDQEYKELLIFCRQHLKTNGMKVILDMLLDNQENRTRFTLSTRDYVYTHEWLILLVLLVSSDYFLLSFDYGSTVAAKIVPTLVATGLVLPYLSLVKLARRTHKDAQGTWQPMSAFLETDYRDFDQK